MADTKFGSLTGIGDMSPTATDKEKIDYLVKAYKRLEDVVILLTRDITNAMQTIDSSNVTDLDADIVNIKNLDADSIKTGSLIVGTNVAIGTAKDAAGVTSIIGGTVNTSYVNALGITAASVAAENITGTTITGKTIQTASSGLRMLMNSSGLYSLNYSSQYDGLCVLASGSYFKESAIYANNVKMIGLVYDDYGTGTFFTDGGANLRIESAGNITLDTYYNLAINNANFGIFGITPVSRQTAAKLDVTATLGDVINKVNGLIDKFALYGLIQIV